GRREASIAEMKRARDLDPLALSANYGLASAFYRAGQYDEAIAEARRIIEIDPNRWHAHRLSGLAYEQKGMYAEATAAFQKAVIVSGTPLALASLGHAYAVVGKRKEAESCIRELKELSQHRYVSPYLIATVYMGLGERDQALQWLVKAYEG